MTLPEFCRSLTEEQYQGFINYLNDINLQIAQTIQMHIDTAGKLLDNGIISEEIHLPLSHRKNWLGEWSVNELAVNTLLCVQGIKTFTWLVNNELNKNI